VGNILLPFQGVCQVRGGDFRGPGAECAVVWSVADLAAAISHLQEIGGSQIAIHVAMQSAQEALAAFG
jgi:hypothetical protein